MASKVFIWLLSSSVLEFDPTKGFGKVPSSTQGVLPCCFSQNFFFFAWWHWPTLVLLSSSWHMLESRGFNLLFLTAGTLLNNVRLTGADCDWILHLPSSNTCSLPMVLLKNVWANKKKRNTENLVSSSFCDGTGKVYWNPKRWHTIMDTLKGVRSKIYRVQLAKLMK